MLVIILTLAFLALFIPSSSAYYFAPNIPTVKHYAYYEIVDVWGHEEVKPFFEIIRRESEWNPKAQNPESTAFGIGQFLIGTWKLVGHEKTENPYKQIDAMIEYVLIVYGTPTEALIKHNKVGHY